MSLLTAYTTATNDAFINRVRMALIDVALTLIIDAGAPADQKTFARKVLREPRVWASHFAFGGAADETLTNASTDAQIKTKLQAIFPSYVGAF